MKRIPPVSPVISDYIVHAVMENKNLMLENSSRMMYSNRARKEAWIEISHKIFRKFNVHLSPLQIKNHFNNRKKKVLLADTNEKRYRMKTGGGFSPEREHEINKRNENDEDLKMYNYFTSKTAHNGLKNADTLQLAKERSSSSQHEPYDDDLRSVHLEEHEIEAFEDETDAISFDEDEEPEPHNVSMAQLRKLEAKKIKFQTKCFDAWARQANVQIEIMQNLLQLMKEMMQRMGGTNEQTQSIHFATDAVTQELGDANIESSELPE